MAKHLLVVGAGTGGLMVANHVARHLSREIERGEVAVTLLGDRDDYVYQPGFLYVAFDLMRMEELVRPVKELISTGITFIKDKAVKIEAENNRVYTESGKKLDYDYLVLATGSDINPQEVPGLAEGGHYFYTAESALKLRDALAKFNGGRLVMAVGMPHKCPVAPLEFVFMFDEWCRHKGIREKTEIIYTFPINRAHSIQAVADWAAPEFEKRGIQLETFFNMDSVDPTAHEITSMEGSTYKYDLLVVIPPHKGATVHGQSGLTDDNGNWLPTGRHNLQVGKHENVFVVGDAAALPVSKAGSVAHFEAEVVGGNLVSLLTGGTPNHFYQGKTFCFIESGLDQATYIQFDYNHPPVVTPPSQALHWFKQGYNRIHWLNLKGVV